MDVARVGAFGVLLIIAAVLYVLASYINFKFPQKNLAIAIAIASTIAAIEYMFKVPAYEMVRHELNPDVIHVIWIVVAFVATNLYQMLVLHRPVHARTWIVGALIICLVTYLLVADRRDQTPSVASKGRT